MKHALERGGLDLVGGGPDVEEHRLPEQTLGRLRAGEAAAFTEAEQQDGELGEQVVDADADGDLGDVLGVADGLGAGGVETRPDGVVGGELFVGQRGQVCVELGSQRAHVVDDRAGEAEADARDNQRLHGGAGLEDLFGRSADDEVSGNLDVFALHAGRAGVLEGEELEGDIDVDALAVAGDAAEQLVAVVEDGAADDLVAGGCASDPRHRTVEDEVVALPSGRHVGLAVAAFGGRELGDADGGEALAGGVVGQEALLERLVLAAGEQVDRAVPLGEDERDRDAAAGDSLVEAELVERIERGAAEVGGHGQLPDVGLGEGVERALRPGAFAVVVGGVGGDRFGQGGEVERVRGVGVLASNHASILPAGGARVRAKLLENSGRRRPEVGAGGRLSSAEAAGRRSGQPEMGPIMIWPKRSKSAPSTEPSGVPSGAMSNVSQSSPGVTVAPAQAWRQA